MENQTTGLTKFLPWLNFPNFLFLIKVNGKETTKISEKHAADHKNHTALSYAPIQHVTFGNFDEKLQEPTCFKNTEYQGVLMDGLNTSYAHEINAFFWGLNGASKIK